jgi:hypothetical protein
MHVISGQIVWVKFIATVGTHMMVATEQQVVAMSVDGGSGERPFGFTSNADDTLDGNFTVPTRVLDATMVHLNVMTQIPDNFVCSVVMYRFFWAEPFKRVTCYV